MKLYLVMSDTHGNVLSAKKVVENYSQLDGIIHLGDYYKDGLTLRRHFPGIQWIQVPGNCDFLTNVPQEAILETEGKKILLTHGNRYDVKSGIGRLKTRALKDGFHGVLFGHTHIPMLKTESDVLFLNPGSLGYPRGFSGSTYALLEIGSGRIEARILDC